MKQGPIIIVDDDPDDRDFLSDAWEELEYDNPLLFLNNGKSVLDYLKSGKPAPFLIICDVNIPGMDGFELKDKMVENREVNYKSIPFIYWSTSASKYQIQKAYDLGVNGFFIKEDNFKDLKKSLIDIIEYWSKSKTPEPA